MGNYRFDNNTNIINTIIAQRRLPSLRFWATRVPARRANSTCLTSIDPRRSTLALRLDPTGQIRSTWPPRCTPNDLPRSTLDRFCTSIALAFRWWSFLQGIKTIITQRRLPSFDPEIRACLLDVPTRPAWPRSTHVDRLWCFDWTRTTSFDRLGRVDVPRTTYLGRLWNDFAFDFRRFSMSRRASNTSCSAMLRTLVFAGRRGTSEGSHA